MDDNGAAFKEGEDEVSGKVVLLLESHDADPGLRVRRLPEMLHKALERDKLFLPPQPLQGCLGLRPLHWSRNFLGRMCRGNIKRHFINFYAEQEKKEEARIMVSKKEREGGEGRSETHRVTGSVTSSPALP